MAKIIQDKDHKISYKIRSFKRAKRLGIFVHYNGEITVTKPKNVSYHLTENVVRNRMPWIIDKLNSFRINYPSASGQSSRADFLANRDRAIEFVTNRLDYWNRFYHFIFNKISVKNHKTLWGSCTKKGDLNFNYRIVKLPEYVADYVIVHEMCHLKEFNHSKKFWHLVSQSFSDCKKIRAKLKTFKIY